MPTAINKTSPSAFAPSTERREPDQEGDPPGNPAAATGTDGHHEPYARTKPRSLGDALRSAGIPLGGAGPGSDTPSEEDYDVNVRPALARSSGLRRRQTVDEKPPQTDGASAIDGDGYVVRDENGVRIYADDEKALQEFLRRSSRRARDPDSVDNRSKFSGFVFSKRFSAFDRNNAVAANSTFYGFYNLFWLSVALFVFKISADNWRMYGNPLGTSDIMRTMFSRDVLVLLASDGVMCGLTGVSWLIQLLVYRGYLNWDRSGWILQHVWQVGFIAGVVGLGHLRSWPWTHRVFFVLHGLVMLMKQHSYAFYNGYLSTVFKRRRFVMSRLKALEMVDPSNTQSHAGPKVSSISTTHLSRPPSAMQRRHSLSQVPKTHEADIDRISRAITGGDALDDEQIHVFERIMKWEIDALTDELRGTADSNAKAYPNNLTFMEHYQWIPLPTVVYELAYPRNDSIDWYYVAEKVAAVVGIIFVMVQISQYSIYPVVMHTVGMKEKGLPLVDRFKEFPWLLSDLLFPFMMEYLLSWYLIWETILNILAELTCFADRNFYDAWWNCVSWDQFARDWNRPVHVFLLRHVYHSSISTWKVNKHTATLITFFLSACVHELVMFCLFNKLRGYLLILQMGQLPLVRLSRTRWLRGRKTLGNLIFWLGIFTGPSVLCSLYLIL